MKGTVKITLDFNPGEATKISEFGFVGTKSEDENEELRKALNSLTAKIDKIQGVPDPRCRDCKHWGRGYTTVNSYSETRVCLKKRKYVMYPRFKDQVLYFAKQGLSKACELFEKKG